MHRLEEINKRKMEIRSLLESGEKIENLDELEKELRKAGFNKAWYQKLTSGIVCLHVGEKAR